MLAGAGLLTISLTPSTGSDRRTIATIDKPKRLDASRLVLRRTVDEAIRMIALVFNVCAAAQERAMRDSLGLKVPTVLEEKLKRELLREHIVKLCATWPEIFGDVADTEVLTLVGEALDNDTARNRLRRALFKPRDGLPQTFSDLSTWAVRGETGAARAFRQVLTDFDAFWGAAQLPLFDPTSEIDWRHARQNGGPVENSPAGRWATHELAQDIEHHIGRGLVWRMALRLIEADNLLRNGAAPAPETFVETTDFGTGKAARGTMLVRASAEAGRLTAFDRLSPTDFALVPGGLMETALASLPALPRLDLERVGRLIVDTIDPCIASRLVVQDA